MKSNSYKSILVAAASMLAVSCNDFLEPESLSTFDAAYIYSNVDDARKGVNAVYSHFGQDAFRSRLSNNFAGNTDIEHQSGWSSSGDRYQIWDLNALESNRDLEIVWTYAYRAIRDANISIEGLKASGKLESEDAAEARTMNHLLGEAVTIKAYWYSILTFYWGDVPFVDFAPVAGGEFLLPKADRNLILTEVINDMIEVEEKMMWADETPYGIEQVTREYTLGMIARLSLQRAGYFLKEDLNMTRATDYLDYYQIARDYSAKLIALKDRELPRDYRQVFLNQSKFISPVNADVLFEIPFALGNGDVAWNIGITVEGGPTSAHTFGSGNNYMAIPPTYYFSFDTLDVRRDVTCALYKVNSSFEEVFVNGSTNIAQGKWSRHFLENPPGASSAKGTGINWPMLRYSDVLLMFAEAENELNGPTPAAQEHLKRVRRRAFDEGLWAEKVDAYVTGVSASKEDFFEAIVDERAWEFGGEMIRKYELIRWGNYSQKMEETVEGLKKMADDAYNGTGDLPDYMYWKLDEKGDFTILNPNTKVVAPPDDSWTQVSFLLSMHDETKTYADWITKDWNNYYNGPKPGVARYIFPIPASAVANSQGTLDNSGYGF
ncbi:RagB/SusD family nutrient uptake outer membrane protein [Algoriphagus terrigena]|uniref:RagB/SusD family nutrient uptake outer membrane protein n=1 Tax=Algoriphagus terrigena TaxID=344884 RepID=UPI00047D1A3D|nr:RagB/SusD family nutrient uptake outer membrane protein [Algoriphagus terrigena]